MKNEDGLAFILELTVISETRAEFAESVLICAVGMVVVFVNVGDAIIKSNTVCCAVETSLFASDVLSTFPHSINDLVILDTIYSIPLNM